MDEQNLSHPRQKWWILCLYALGLLHWVLFLDGGAIDFRTYDWPYFWVYDHILRQAIVHAQIPYHMSVVLHHTLRFVGIPETNWLPDIFLLRFLPIGTYELFHCLFLFSLGFWGCLLFRARYRLSLFAFAALVVLFNLNGFVNAKIAMGLSSWEGYFFLPLIFYVLLKGLDGQTRHFVSALSACLFILMLSGGLHIFVITSLFLAIVGLTHRPLLKRIALGVGLAGLLSACRILPAALTFWHRSVPLTASYPTLTNVLEGLLCLRSPGYKADVVPRVYWHEFDYFFGIIGCALLVYFGIVYRLRRRSAHVHPYEALDIPLAITALLGLNVYYYLIARIPLPLMNVERIPSRFLMIPLVVLIFLACIRLQDFLNAGYLKTFKHKIFAGILFLQMSVELGTHSLYWWYPSRASTEFSDRVLPAVCLTSIPTDTLYMWLVHAGFILTFLAVVLLAGVWFKECRRKI